MNNAYDVVDLQQGTTEWLEWRSNGIGGSDAPAIMGENPWKNTTQLLLEKLGAGNKVVTNAVMARGTTLEPEARKRYETVRNIRVAPACLQSTAHEWQRASVDGLAANVGAVVEIKCGESAYRKRQGAGKCRVIISGSCSTFWRWRTSRTLISSAGCRIARKSTSASNEMILISISPGSWSPASLLAAHQAKAVAMMPNGKLVSESSLIV